MFKSNTIFITLLTLLISSVFVLADGTDDEGNPNDPNVNDRANACYEGGAMEGKCDTDWEWMCGWHVIRLDPQNEDLRASFPPACISLLPPLIVPEVVAPVVVSRPTSPTLAAGCYVYSGSFSLQWNGGSGPYNTVRYSTTNCTGPVFAVTSSMTTDPALASCPSPFIFPSIQGNSTTLYYCGNLP